MSGEEAVCIVGNDPDEAAAMAGLFGSVAIEPLIYDTPVDFLRGFAVDRPCCILMEMRMPKLSGLELLARLSERGCNVPAIVATAFGEVTSAVRAMKLGAVEFLEKPVKDELLLEYVQHWIAKHRAELEAAKRRAAAGEKLARLSPREREVLGGVLDGKSSKQIARDLGVSPKAIELYRSKLMTKMAAPSLAVLIREALSFELRQEGAGGVSDHCHLLKHERRQQMLTAPCNQR